MRKAETMNLMNLNKGESNIRKFVSRNYLAFTIGSH